MDSAAWWESGRVGEWMDDLGIARLLPPAKIPPCLESESLLSFTCDSDSSDCDNTTAQHCRVRPPCAFAPTFISPPLHQPALLCYTRACRRTTTRPTASLSRLSRLAQDDHHDHRRLRPLSPAHSCDLRATLF